MGLSRPIEELRDEYDVVIVGSGYGGSIAASRLARAGKRVCLLERGREFEPGEFPRSMREATEESQIDTPDLRIGPRDGLLDFRINPTMNVVVGCGLGGGSLINAGACIIPNEEVFAQDDWPEALRGKKTELMTYYHRVESMLRPVKYPTSEPALRKWDALDDSAKVFGRRAERIPIAVNFKEGQNPQGVFQKECVLCGDCCAGCNYGAKNTLVTNYLPDAAAWGAEIFTRTDVQYLEKEEGHWVVHFRVFDAGRERFNPGPMTILAKHVILAAGTLGSTEILLRSRAHGLTLSRHIGEGFSGNGDVIGFAYNGEDRINGVGWGNKRGKKIGPVGPTITGVIDMRSRANADDADVPLERQVIVQEGAIPGPLANLMPKVMVGTSVFHGERTQSGFEAWMRQRLRGIESFFAGAYRGAMNRTQMFLVMSHDAAEGKMRLDEDNDRLRVDWPGVGKQHPYPMVDELLTRASEPDGATYVENPMWTKAFGYDVVTVHPLGGCAMGETGDDGVVNHRGQVFVGDASESVHRGLHVMDGSVVPRSLGVNPLMTISALAERSVELLAEAEAWEISNAPTPPLPVDPDEGKAGLRFTERMRGWVTSPANVGAPDPDDGFRGPYREAWKRGKADGSDIDFVVTIVSRDVEFMIADPRHRAKLFGVVECPLLSPEPLGAHGGDFALFEPEPGEVETKKMKYQMVLQAEDNTEYFLDGFKHIHDDRGFDSWRDTTELYVDIYRGVDTSGELVAQGMLRIRFGDFWKQLNTMKITGDLPYGQRLKHLAHFGKFFAGALYNTYGGIVSELSSFEDRMQVRARRPLVPAPSEIHHVETSDGIKIRLTRMSGGDRGPVILAPGFGVSTLSFTIDTVPLNFPEYLCAQGFDVWLMDYRFSPELPSAIQGYNIDDVAEKDWPAAVHFVRTHTGRESVQVVGHCVGSLSFLMGVTGGSLTGIRSAICSQLTLHPVSWWENRLKARIPVPEFLEAIGIHRINPSARPDWRSNIVDTLIQAVPIPAGEDCNHPVCRRIFSVYGPSYAHAQLNDATHDAIHEMFGPVAVEPFEQFADMVRAGLAVNRAGDPIYTERMDRIDFPTLFIAGEHNKIFYPATSQRTFEAIREVSDTPEIFERWVIPDYAHMDVFMGKNAVKDVYPRLLEFLERTEA